MGCRISENVAAGTLSGTVFADVTPPGTGAAPALEKAECMPRHGIKRYILRQLPVDVVEIAF